MGVFANSGNSELVVLLFKGVVIFEDDTGPILEVKSERGPLICIAVFHEKKELRT